MPSTGSENRSAWSACRCYRHGVARKFFAPGATRGLAFHRQKIFTMIQASGRAFAQRPAASRRALFGPARGIAELHMFELDAWRCASSSPPTADRIDALTAAQALKKPSGRGRRFRCAANRIALRRGEGRDAQDRGDQTIRVGSVCGSEFPARFQAARGSSGAHTALQQWQHEAVKCPAPWAPEQMPRAKCPEDVLLQRAGAISAG